MRTYLIDPHKKEVTEVDYDGDYKKIYELIRANTFDVVRWKDSVDIFIDDEGLYVEDQAFFQLHSSGQPLAGYGLVTGTDVEGETIACPWTLERVRSLIVFPDVQMAGFTPLPAGLTVERFGEKMPLIGHTVEFEPRALKPKETKGK